MTDDRRPALPRTPRTAHERAALLADAVHELRAISADVDARPIPVEFIAMAIARLLEEISRAALAGQEPPQRVLDAAVEIARHALSYSPRR